MGTGRVLSGQLPRAFGKYVLQRELGRGAMGIVFEAVDTGLDRRVALKMMLPSENADPRETAIEDTLFTREAQLCARLEKHPNLVSVYDSGSFDGRRYIAMEYIDGLPLSDWTKANKPSLRTRIKMLRDVAIAVHHAHEAGILHRDLKPKNVLVDRQNRPFVSDFGMAKRVGSESGSGMSSSSSAGTVVGTPSYMSPEQAQGLKKIDRRTDVYALGAMLYEILTGAPPFPGEMTIVALMRVVQDAIPTPSSVSPEWAASTLDKSIETLCMRALSKNPDDRPASALVLAEQLNEWLDEKPLKLGAPKASKLPLLFAAAALALLGLTALLVLRPFSGEAAPDFSKAYPLLDELDPQKDATVGTWKREGSALVSGGTGRLELLKGYVLPDYDLEAVFVRREGAGEVGVALPRAVGPLLWTAKLPVAGQPYRASFRVRGRVVVARLQGPQIDRVETLDGVAPLDATWKPRDPSRLQIGSTDAVIEFRSLRVVAAH